MGKDFALRLLSKGHVVYGLARRVEKMDEIVAAGGNAVAMDITDSEQVERAVQQVLTEQGHIDILINNAGYAVYGTVEEVPIDMARRQFEVNIFGLASLTQMVIPGMREQRSGRIINILSMGGKVYAPMGAWYHATKHALEGWSDCFRLELAVATQARVQRHSSKYSALRPVTATATACRTLQTTARIPSTPTSETWTATAQAMPATMTTTACSTSSICAPLCPV
jgi:short-subunit dehydrogenase